MDRALRALAATLHRVRGRAAWGLVACACLGLGIVGPAWAQKGDGQERKREVPAELVPVINAAQRALEASDPEAALRILKSWEGEPDPLQQLLAGYAHFDLEAYPAAARAFGEALQMDPGLSQARTGLARTRAAQDDWPGVIAALKDVVDVQRSSAPEIGLYARAAFEEGDLRLASVLVERGMLRFPDDVALRRLDIATLLKREAWGEASEAALGLLATNPDDALLWRQLAAATERSDSALSMAALEAATLAAPEDARLALGLAGRLVEAGALEAGAEILETVPPTAPGREAVAQRLESAGPNRPAGLKALRGRVDAGRASAKDYLALGKLQLVSAPEQGKAALLVAMSACSSNPGVAAQAAALLAENADVGSRARLLDLFQQQCGVVRPD
ncbi:MAG: tetratricopeptide repeat protein [Myxococcota bacterium]